MTPSINITSLESFVDVSSRLDIDMFSLVRESRILDAGCGNGRLVAELQKYNSNVWGVDRDYDSIYGKTVIGGRIYGAKEISQYPDRILYADVTDLPFLFPPDYFDVVFAIGLYHSASGSALSPPSWDIIRFGNSQVMDIQRQLTLAVYNILKKGGLYFVLDQTENFMVTGDFKTLYQDMRSYKEGHAPIRVLRK